jgi:putative redox protein
VKRVTAGRRKGYAHDLRAGRHAVVADEPESCGGTDTGPSPAQLLAMSLASCTAVTVEMYADRKEWEVGDLEVEVEYELDRKGGISRFDVLVKMPPELAEEQVERLLAIARRCPVHRALSGDVEISDRVARA